MNIQAFLNLPGPVKAGIAALTGASLLAVLFMLARGNSTFFYILTIIIIVIAVTGGAYAVFLRSRKKKKSKNMDRMLQQHNTGSPSSLGGADVRVKLDDMRQRFASGIQQYRKHGKDLYSLPWYVIIGEPGSGKTEAIRHSGIGFPPNLQNEQQGVGGTINMDWWFTNQGVILDTAGKLIFGEDVDEEYAKSSEEWREFLTLLRKNRPDCPINGLILTIPTDSLIKYSSAQIEEKAKVIAVKLDEIQRILDIRFPVFVIITKSGPDSRIPAVLQGSAPSRPRAPDGWLVKSGHRSMRPSTRSRWRTTFLVWSNRLSAGVIRSCRNPTTAAWTRGNAGSARLTRSMPSPRALEDIFPRLRRFLDLIFVAGEWAQKPLFLRGIYFTSSLQEGAVLDKEVASALGMPVDSLPEDMRFERKGSLFLRDFFVEKAFRERNLVTRASNANRVVRRRQILVFSMGFTAMAASLLFAWFGASSLRSAIGQQQDYWKTAASDQLWDGNRWRLPIVEDSLVSDTYLSNEDKLIQVGDRQVGYVEFLDRLADYSKRDLRIPTIFKPIEWVASGVTRREIDRSRGFKVLFDAGVLFPIVEGVRSEFELPDDPGNTSWSPEASNALIGLIRLERLLAERELGIEATYEAPFDFISRFMLYLTGKPGDSRLVEAAEWLYDDGGQFASEWPPAWVSSGDSLERNRPIRGALEKFIKHVDVTAGTQRENLELLQSVLSSLVELDAAEDAFLAAVGKVEPSQPGETLEQAVNIYRTRIVPAQGKLAEYREECLRNGIINQDETFLLSRTYERELEAARESIQGTIDGIRAELPESGPLMEPDLDLPEDERLSLFKDILTRLTEAQAEITEVLSSAFSDEELAQLDRFDTLFLSASSDGKVHYESRLALYEAYISRLQAEPDRTSPIGELEDRAEDVQRLLRRLNNAHGDYIGPKETPLLTAKEQLEQTLEKQRFHQLAAAYEAGLAELTEGLRFPLVLPVSNEGLVPDEVESVNEVFDEVEAELRSEAAEAFAKSDLDDLSDFLDRLEPVRNLGKSLIEEGGKPLIVEVRLPDNQVQKRVLERILNTNAYQLVNFKWQEVGLNQEKPVRTRSPLGALLGKVAMDSTGLSLRFFRHSAMDEDNIEFSGAWAPLQWLLSKDPVAEPGGQDFHILVQRTEEEVDYHMIVSMKFPGPLPRPDNWPKLDDLLTDR
jgi:hypothetical protein